VSEPRGTDLCFQASGSGPSYKSTREYSQMRAIRGHGMRRLQDQVCMDNVLVVADSARRYCPMATTAMLTGNQSWLA